MEKLIELLEQIQELAGVGVDALKGAAGGERGGPPQGGAPAEGGEPKPEPKPEGKPEGDEPKY